MSIQLSKKLATLIASGTPARTALSRFVRNIYSGTIPATADSAINGTLLATMTKDGNAVTTWETKPEWKIALSGADGTLDVVTLGGISILPAATTSGTPTAVAALAAAAINAAFNALGIAARSSSGDLFLTGPVGSGTSLNNMVAAATGTTITVAVASTGKPAASGGTDGVAADADFCAYDYPAVDGVLTATQIWKDSSADASGTATWFRDVYESGDTGTASTAYIRKQGTITSIGGGGDMELANTAITATTPVTTTSAAYPTFTIPST